MLFFFIFDIRVNGETKIGNKTLKNNFESRYTPYIELYDLSTLRYFIY